MAPTLCGSSAPCGIGTVHAAHPIREHPHLPCRAVLSKRLRSGCRRASTLSTVGRLRLEREPYSCRHPGKSPWLGPRYRTPRWPSLQLAQLARTQLPASTWQHHSGKNSNRPLLRHISWPVKAEVVSTSDYRGCHARELRRPTGGAQQGQGRTPRHARPLVRHWPWMKPALGPRQVASRSTIRSRRNSPPQGLQVARPRASQSTDASRFRGRSPRMMLTATHWVSVRVLARHLGREGSIFQVHAPRRLLMLIYFPPTRIHGR